MSFFERLMTPINVLITNRAVRWIVGLVLGLGIVLLLLPPTQIAVWVGQANVETTFRVLDENTGQPIPGALIRIRKSYVLSTEPSDGELQDTLISTHADGKVEFPCGPCTSYGKSGGWTDTYHLELPDWIFRVSAEGYEVSDWTSLTHYGYHVESRRSLQFDRNGYCGISLFTSRARFDVIPVMCQ